MDRVDENALSKFVLADDSLTSDDECHRYTKIKRYDKMTLLMNQPDFTSEKLWYTRRDDPLHSKTDVPSCITVYGRLRSGCHQSRHSPHTV